VVPPPLKKDNSLPFPLKISGGKNSRKHHLTDIFLTEILDKLKKVSPPPPLSRGREDTLKHLSGREFGIDFL